MSPNGFGQGTAEQAYQTNPFFLKCRPEEGSVRTAPNSHLSGLWERLGVSQLLGLPRFCIAASFFVVVICFFVCLFLPFLKKSLDRLLCHKKGSLRKHGIRADTGMVSPSPLINREGLENGQSSSIIGYVRG